jgi:hypothetical protein
MFPGFTVEPILARHGEPPAELTSVFNKTLQSVALQPTPDQVAEHGEIAKRGTADPRVVTEGTIAYLITLDTGFRIMYRDSGGTVTDIERATLQRLGGVDLAIAATSASFLTNLLVDQALEYARLYKPRVYMPAHHDGSYSELWRPTESIFQAIKDQSPGVVTNSKGYREPTCFNTTDSIGSRSR